MAVAADSHRDFLIPGHTVTQYVRQRGSPRDDLCLFFCCLYYATRRRILQEAGAKKCTFPALRGRAVWRKRQKFTQAPSFFDKGVL